MLTSTTLIGVVVWLLPLIVYLLAFHDPPNMRVLWGIVTVVFSWLGLLARFVFGIVKGTV